MFIILKTINFQFWLSYKSDLCILFILQPAGTNLGITVQIREFQGLQNFAAVNVKLLNREIV